MIIVAINHYDFEGRPSEGLGGGKSTKPRSDDDDAGARGCLIETIHDHASHILLEWLPNASIVFDARNSFGYRSDQQHISPHDPRFSQLCRWMLQVRYPLRITCS